VIEYLDGEAYHGADICPPKEAWGVHSNILCSGGLVCMWDEKENKGCICGAPYFPSLKWPMSAKRQVEGRVEERVEVERWREKWRK